jgi:hypothetical protein
MNRAISSYSDTSSIDEETLLQQELARLQRQYRVMENERKEKTLNARILRGTQETAITQLEKELKELDTNMKLANRPGMKKQDRENSKTLKNFMMSQDEYLRLVNAETQDIQSLDRQISEIEENINAQHRQMGGVHDSHQRHVTTQHTIRVLENRLNKATREFNEMLAQNAKLREDIQHLRNQRGIFDTIHKLLCKNLIGKKREQLELIEQSTQAFDQRDEAEQNKATLQDRNQKDLVQYNMEYKELMRQLDHDTALKKFLLDKAQERWELAESSANERKKNFEAKSERQAEKTLKEFLDAFRAIKTITGEDQNEKLVERFIQMEDQNFAMFTYVNEINNQLVRKNDEIRMLENEIKIYKADAGESIEAKMSEFTEVDVIYQSKSGSATKTSSKMAEQTSLLSDLRAGVSKIFDNTSCSKDQIKNRLGNQTEVTNQNIMDYLSVIEEKANDMVKRHIIVSASHDSLAKATVCKDNDDPGAPPAVEDQVKTEDKSLENKSDTDITVDIASLRQKAKQNVIAREKERAQIQSEKPHSPMKEGKARKNKK